MGMAIVHATALHHTSVTTPSHKTPSHSRCGRPLRPGRCELVITSCTACVRDARPSLESKRCSGACVSLLTMRRKLPTPPLEAALRGKRSGAPTRSRGFLAPRGRLAAMALSSRGVKVVLLLHMTGRGACFPGRPARFSAPPPSASAGPSAAAEPQEEEVLRSNAYPLCSNAYP